MEHNARPTSLSFIFGWFDLEHLGYSVYAQVWRRGGVSVAPI
jgi:hypothetical protein